MNTNLLCYIAFYFLIAYTCTTIYMLAKVWINFSTLTNQLKSQPIISDTINVREYYRRYISISIVKLCVAVTLSDYFYRLYNGMPMGSLDTYLLSNIGAMFICVFLQNGIHNFYSRISIAQEIVDDIDIFSLYLRPFSIDKNKSVRKIEQQMCKHISEFIKIYAIGNPCMVMPMSNAEALYTTDDDWKHIVLQMMQKAKFIVLHVGDSEGCSWEMDRNFECEFYFKTIFLVNSNLHFDSLKSRLSQYAPISSGMTNFHTTTAIYYDEIKQIWSVAPFDGRKQIQQVLDSFIRSNSKCCELLNKHIENKKKLLFKIFNSDNFPKEIKLGSLGAFANIFAYAYVNKWNWKIVAIPWILPIIARLASPFYYDGIWISTICFLLFAQFFITMPLTIILAPRISWLSRIWPSVNEFKRSNKDFNNLMKDIYKIHFFTAAIILIIYLIF